MTHMTIKKTMLESISRFKSSKGDLLRAQGMTMAVWAACLCPLLFLLSASLRPLALLCPLMLIFIALPMRQSTAEAMQLFLSGAFLTAIPGIILQLVFIPALMVALDRTGMVRFARKTQSVQASN